MGTLVGTARVVQISTSGGHSPRWSPDGSTLYYASGLTSIWAASVSVSDDVVQVTSRVEPFTGLTDRIPGFFDLDPYLGVSYDVSPEGDLLVIEVLAVGQMLWILGWPELVREMAAR